MDVLRKVRQMCHLSGDPPAPPQPGDSDPFSAFWERYNRLDAQLRSIDYAIGDVVKLDEEMLMCSDERQGEIVEEMGGKLDSLRGEVQDVRRDLEQLDKDVKEREKDESQKGSPEVRLQRNHVNLLSNNFQMIANKFQDVNARVKNSVKEEVKRKMFVAEKPVTDEQAEAMVVEDPAILTTNLFQLTGGAQTQEVVSTYNMIASRHQEILEMERQLNEILELFVQFSIILHEQGRMIDNIETNLATAKNYVETGVKELEAAKKHQKKARKWLWFLVIGGIILLVVVVVLAIVIPKVT